MARLPLWKKAGRLFFRGDFGHTAGIHPGGKPRINDFDLLQKAIPVPFLCRLKTRGKKFDRNTFVNGYLLRELQEDLTSGVFVRHHFQMLAGLCGVRAASPFQRLDALRDEL